MTTASIAEEIAEALAPGFIAGRVFDYVPDAIVPPTCVVGFPAIEYDQDMAGDNSAMFPVYVLISKATEKGALRKLEPYMSPVGATSVKALLEADRTLGGAVSSLRVTRATVGPIEVGAQPYIGATFSVEVYFSDYFQEED